MKLLLIALVIVLSSPFVRAQVGFEPGIGCNCGVTRRLKIFA